MKPTSEDVAKWIRESPTTYEIPSFIAGQAYKAGTAAQLERMLAGVEMPEPAYVCAPYDPITGQLTRVVVNYYTANQLRSTVAAAVAKTNAAWQVVNQVREEETDELRAELAQRDAHIVEYNTRIQAEVLKLLNEKDALKAENERLRADAARYQWLRDNHRSAPQHKLTWYLPMNYPRTDNGLDAAIDAALKGQP